MRPRSCRAPAVRPTRQTGRDPPSPSRVADCQRRLEADDLAGVAPCPLCRAPLVARMGRRGPYFHCACAESASPYYRR